MSEQNIMTIPREEIRKYLKRTLAMLVISFIFIPISYIFSFGFPSTTLMFLLFFSDSLVALICYFINPEIMYGMMISRKKYKRATRRKDIETRYIKLGRRIFLGIWLIGVVLILPTCIFTLYLLLS